MRQNLLSKYLFLSTKFWHKWSLWMTSIQRRCRWKRNSNLCTKTKYTTNKTSENVFVELINSHFQQIQPWWIFISSILMKSSQLLRTEWQFYSKFNPGAALIFVIPIKRDTCTPLKVVFSATKWYIHLQSFT